MTKQKTAQYADWWHQVEGFRGYKTEIKPEHIDDFRRLWRSHCSNDVARMLGVCNRTVYRFAERIGCKEDRDFERINKIRHKRGVRACEKSGYYASLKGHAPSAACLAAARVARRTQVHPFTHIKLNDPKRYAKMIKKRRETRNSLIASEQKRVSLGMAQKTNLHIPTYRYDNNQRNVRWRMMRKGYILGDIRENVGERYIIYYDDNTQRVKRMETAANNNGFTIKQLI